jgi:hypothetical protein
MKQKFVGLVLGTALVGSLAQGQEFAPAPTDVPHLIEADLFIDLAEYAGKQMVVTDARVHGASNSGALMEAGPRDFRNSSSGIDH